MSEAILKAINEHAEKTQSSLSDIQAKNAELNARLQVTEQAIAENNGGGGLPGQGSRFNAVAKAINGNDQLEAIRQRKATQAQVPMHGVSLKAIVGDQGSDNTFFDSGATRYPGFGEDARRKLSLLEALTVLKVDNGTFEFTQLSNYTNAAGEQVQQGDVKAVQDTQTGLQTADIRTVAVTEPVSEQVLADSPSLLAFLQSRMLYNVREKLERMLVTQMLADAGNEVTVEGASLADLIGEADAVLSDAGWQAGLIVVNPHDWQMMRSERSQNEGIYIAGGWNQPAAPNVWGVPVVVNGAVPRGEALVIDPSQSLLLDREQAGFAFNYVDDGFTRNIITARAEIRAGLAMLSPSAVQKLTF